MPLASPAFHHSTARGPKGGRGLKRKLEKGTSWSFLKPQLGSGGAGPLPLPFLGAADRGNQNKATFVLTSCPGARQKGASIY